MIIIIYYSLYNYLFYLFIFKFTMHKIHPLKIEFSKIKITYTEILNN